MDSGAPLATPVPSPFSDLPRGPLGQGPRGMEGVPGTPLGRKLPRTPKTIHKTLSQLVVWLSG